jgi:transcriptional regulator with XRE-family HTH domain
LKERDQLVNEDVGRKIRLARKRSHLTLGELAKLLGIKAQTLGRYESGVILIGVPTLLAICRVLHETPDQLLAMRDGTSPEAWKVARAFDQIDAARRKAIMLLIERDTPVSGDTV